ncbi:MAG: amino acid--[acyl-carrier-protein] ligase [Actinomycetota bacterium]|nr:amino acid--[acyl-carrier-protein] ligase [Actinomycetota bacterium]
MPAATRAERISDSHREFRQELFDTGLLRDGGLDGLYLRSARFEQIVAGIDALVARTGAHHGAEVLHFPLLIPRLVLERSGYPRSFPDLTGVVHGFAGGEPAHSRLMQALDGNQPRQWTAQLGVTDIALCSAACHPLYPSQAGSLPPQGRVVEVHGQCFRREPSVDPARMQAFRQHEFVYLGTADGAQAHRDDWVHRALELHRNLGLQVEAVVANDPFFGRAGRMLAANQRLENLKIEIVTPLYATSEPTAITSANIHQDHFGDKFAILADDGSTAHTACVGFGLERIALALLRTHGLDIDTWPADVGEALGL